MSRKKKSLNPGVMKKVMSIWQQVWVEQVVQNGFNPLTKLLFLRIASFGSAGCYMSNETLAKELGSNERSVRRAISALFDQDDLIITHWDGHGRTMYAKNQPHIRDGLNLIVQERLKNDRKETYEKLLAKMRIRGFDTRPDMATIPARCGHHPGQIWPGHIR